MGLWFVVLLESAEVTRPTNKPATYDIGLLARKHQTSPPPPPPPPPKVIKLFSCSTQLSKKFQLLIQTVLAFKLSYVVIIMLKNVKMPTIVGILTFTGRINFALQRCASRQVWLSSSYQQVLSFCPVYVIMAIFA